MSKIYLKPKVGEVVIWTTPEGRTYADTVTRVGDLNKYRYTGSYLRNIYLRGGCMIDQRMIVAVLPAGTIIDQATFDNNSIPGYTRDRRGAKDRTERERNPIIDVNKPIAKKRSKSKPVSLQ